MVYFIVTACHFLLQYKDNLIFPFDVLQLEKLMVKYNLFLQELTGSCFISNEQSQARRVGNTFFRKTDNPLSDCFEILLVRHLVQQLLIPVIHFIHQSPGSHTRCSTQEHWFLHSILHTAAVPNDHQNISSSFHASFNSAEPWCTPFKVSVFPENVIVPQKKSVDILIGIISSSQKNWPVWHYQSPEYSGLMEFYYNCCDY